MEKAMKVLACHDNKSKHHLDNYRDIIQKRSCSGCLRTGQLETPKWHFKLGSDHNRLGFWYTTTMQKRAGKAGTRTAQADALRREDFFTGRGRNPPDQEVGVCNK
jgi:hypothetical protein